MNLKKIFYSLLLFFSTVSFGGLNVMGPLFIDSEVEWEKFEKRLHDLKKNGVSSISTDVWWGSVEEQQGIFDWSYYDRIATLIQNSGLKWVPIMSFHQCGGNVGDNCDIPLPKWVWEYAKGKSIPSLFGGDSFNVNDESDIKYISELGKMNGEFPSVWSTPLMSGLYVNFVKAFSEQYKSKKHIIEELNISLGPAGELRYPAYNVHDQYYSQSPAMFPRRGSFQGHSDLAKKSYRDYLKLKYSNNIENFNQAVKAAYNSFEDITPPDHEDFNDFEKYGSHYLEVNNDVFDWYHQSLLSHGELILKSIDKAKSEGDLLKVPLGVKIPGIHWNMGEDFGVDGGIQWSHRLTEINSGLINPGDDLIEDINNGVGYKSLLSRMKKIEDEVSSSLILHFTCLEMGNNENSHLNANSMAKSLVHWFGKEAKKNGLIIKGENALEGSLYSSKSWFNIKDSITHAGYDGLTILRMGELTDNKSVMMQIKEASSQISAKASANCLESIKRLIK